MKKLPETWKAFCLGAFGSALVISSLLALQQGRHGWPFVNESPAMPGMAGGSHPSPAPTATRTGIALGAGQAQAMDIRFSRVEKGLIDEQVRVTTTVVPDESRLAHVHTRIAGWIERLHVSNTGERVHRGQPLVDIFSQELLASQTEYLAARQASAPSSAVVDAGRARLAVLGMSEEDIRAIERSGQPRRVVTLSAPVDGAMLHRGVAPGTAVDPSTEIMIVADLSKVWVLAEVPESAVAEMKPGVKAQLEFPASGRAAVMATVEFVDPVLSERTRTVRVRFSVANGDGSLRPGQFGTAVFMTQPRQALIVPRDAVVDTGEASYVYVVGDGNAYEPRVVTLGARLKDRVEVISGLREGESIVTSGVFLIDSESRLRASGGASSGHGGHGGASSGAAEKAVPSGGSPESSHQGHGS